MFVCLHNKQVTNLHHKVETMVNVKGWHMSVGWNIRAGVKRFVNEVDNQKERSPSIKKPQYVSLSTMLMSADPSLGGSYTCLLQ